jgi:hypothetical protein
VKHNTLRGQSFLMVQQMVHLATTGLQNVNILSA